MGFAQEINTPKTHYKSFKKHQKPYSRTILRPFTLIYKKNIKNTQMYKTKISGFHFLTITANFLGKKTWSNNWKKNWEHTDIHSDRSTDGRANRRKDGWRWSHNKLKSVWEKSEENAGLSKYWEIHLLRMNSRLLVTNHADFLAQILDPNRCCSIKVWTEGKQWRGIFLLVIHAHTTNLLG